MRKISYAKHICQLGRDSEDVLSKFIDSGLFIKIRRKLKRFLLPNGDHPESRLYLKSTSALRQEQYRNLIHYYYTIHPFSYFNVFREIVMLCIYLIIFVLAPIEITFVNASCSRLLLKFVFDVVFMLNMVLTFVTGYYDRKTSKIVLNRRKIAWHYLKTYFLFDLLSCVPSFTIGVCLSDPHLMNYFRYFNIFKLCRQGTVIELLNNLRNFLGYSAYVYRFIKFLFIVATIVLWITVLDYMYIYDWNVSDEIRYPLLHSFIDALMNLMLVVTDQQVDLDNVNLLIFNIILGCIGFSFEMFLATQMFQIWQIHSVTSNRQNKIMKQINVYMKYKKLPMRLRERIYEYLEFRYKNNFTNIESILDTLSPQIKQEILLHNTRNLLDRVDFFRYLSHAARTKLVTYLKLEIFLPNDILFQIGEPAVAMYFIYTGTVAATSLTGTEVCHFEDGAHFGEIALFKNEPRMATVVAITPCEIYKLNRKDFSEIMMLYPEFRNKINESVDEHIEIIRRREMEIYS